MINKHICFKPARLAIYIAVALSSLCHATYGRDYFNPELLELGNPGAGKTDLSVYESGSQAPGTYHVDIILDEQQVDTRDVQFFSVSDKEGESFLQPCLSLDTLRYWGIKTDLFPDLTKGGNCANISAIPQASAKFEFSTQRLLISIPQAALSPQARGYVPPELWDEGITAAMLNYSLNGANNRGRGKNGMDTNTQYANLRPGVNFGPWRLRNYTTWNRDSNGQDKWDTVYTYLQRDVIPLKAQFTAGDSSAPADIFDSMPFRGAQLASDDDMLPDSMKGYAPVVRGIARTNAQIMIRQNGCIIYQSYVAPGAFEITDMYPTGGAGDLDVTIKEADGSEQHFSVPFASLPLLQREGRLKYAVTAGQYRSYNNSVEKTPFTQMTAIYGLPKGFTLYGGFQESSKYRSIASGIGKNMGDLGALSVDVTQAWSKPENEIKSSGQSWRARYSKNFIETGTNFAIAGYRYSTSGYYGMQEVLDSYSNDRTIPDRRRNRMEVTMNQSLGNDLGSVMLGAIREDYWSSGKTMESVSAGYNNSWHGINYGITYTYSKNGTSDGYSESTRYDKDQQIAINISVPLERFLPSTWANYSMNTSKQNGTTHSLGLSGVALDNNSLNWNVQEGFGTNNIGNSGSMNADYKGSYGEMTAGYGYDSNSERLNYGLQGGILAHENGITLSQPLGETNVLIKAPGAKGVIVQNQTGVRTDFRGYTAASSLTPYRKNMLTLDPESLSDDADLELTTATVTPTRGAVVRAEYIANVGRRILLTLIKSNGDYVPFGAIVSNSNAQSQNGIVGEQGQVYLTGMQDELDLLVKWGDDLTQQCKVKSHVVSDNSNNGVSQFDSKCI